MRVDQLQELVETIKARTGHTPMIGTDIKFLNEQLKRESSAKLEALLQSHPIWCLDGYDEAQWPTKIPGPVLIEESDNCISKFSYPENVKLFEAWSRLNERTPSRVLDDAVVDPVQQALQMHV